MTTEGDTKIAVARHTARMDLDSFWSLVERSAAVSDDPDERNEWLAEELTGLSDSDLLDFHDHLREQMHRVANWLTWHAASLIMRGCSDDGFTGFRAWVVGLGRAAVDSVAEHPDNLADRPEVQRLVGRHMRDWAEAEWPYSEELEFVAVEEYHRRFGEQASIYDALEARGDDKPQALQQVDEVSRDHRDPEEARNRLPRLAAMFPQG